MSRGNVFDEMARSLASPMPRREVLRKFLGGLAAAAAATLVAPGQARAMATCSEDTDCGGNGAFCCNKKVCCASGEICCGTGANSKCCPTGGTCCGTGAAVICCNAGETCTKVGARVSCRTASPR